MKALKWIYVIAVAGLCVSAQAGYRSVKQTGQRKATRPVIEKKLDKPGAQCKRKNGTQLDMGRGFQQATLQPSEEVELSWTKPGLTPHDSVFAYTVHGGRINGEIATTLKPDSSGTVTFRFKIGPWPGNYPIIFRHAGKEDVIEFWIDVSNETSNQKGGAK